MEAEFFGETANIESVDPYMDATYPADETEPPESCYKGSDQSALTSWLRSVAGHRLLTREEEVDLAKRIETAEAKPLDELLQVLVKNNLLSPKTKVALVAEMEASEDGPREALDKLLEVLGKNNLLSDEMIKELAERIGPGGDDARKALVDELLNILVHADTLPDPDEEKVELSDEEKRRLVRRIEIAEAEARRFRDELVQANLRLVISIAVKYQGHNVPLEDLIQEGNIGLIKAASKFDYRKGFKFSTYAIWWIKQAIMRTLDNFSRSIRLPSYVVAKMNKFDSVYATLCQELQREPRREEIAEALDLSLMQVEEILTFNADAISMDLQLSDERSAATLGDLIEDPANSGEEGPIAEMINKDLIAQFLDRLPDREQKVLRMRFGLEDGERKTLREIGEALAVTRERVRQLEIEAIKRLRVLYDEMGEFQSDQSWVGKTAA
ncbi:RNA polymerase sigma factor RpoD [Candidatus Poribacteria bacterium]|nr:MAG: RNA polymerase sigma factor RpoD [Candidatus Poribacteria bacterium]